VNYVVTFGLFGVFMIATGVFHGGWWYLLLTSAPCVLLMSAGYAGLGPGIYFKTRDGRIPFWARLLHYPIVLTSGTEYLLKAAFSKENAYDRVGDDLILGRRPRPNEFPEGVANCVDLAAEFGEPQAIRESTNYVNLPVLDGDVPTQDALRTAIASLVPGTTFVHCAVGHGRTGVFALALLAERGRVKSYEEGIGLLKGVRPGIDLNAKQEAFVRGYFPAASAAQGGACAGSRS
jgi:protein-tyrosine phosphatase